MSHRRREVTVFIGIPSELATAGLLAGLSSRPELHVLATANSLEQSLAALRKQMPAVVIMAPEWVPAFEQWLFEAEVLARLIVFGAKPHLGANAEATAGVACGYFSYLTPGETCWTLVDAVAQCRAPTLDAGAKHCRGCAVRRSLRPPRPDLSAREMEVFIAVGSGLGTSEIAAQLCISVKTVESYRESIKAKLALASARDMSAAAVDWCRGGSP